MYRKIQPHIVFYIKLLAFKNIFSLIIYTTYDCVQNLATHASLLGILLRHMRCQQSSHCNLTGVVDGGGSWGTGGQRQGTIGPSAVQVNREAGIDLWGPID